MLEEDFSIKEFADRLRSRSQEGMGDAQENSSSVPRSIDARQEALIVEKMAKEEGLWRDFSEAFFFRNTIPKWWGKRCLPQS